MSDFQNTATPTPVAKRIIKRDLRISYDIDQKSSQELATEYDVTHEEMKAAIRAAGLVVRKSEIKTQPQPSAYRVVLVDGDQEIDVTCKG